MEKQNSKKMGLINGIVLLVITLGALYLANDTQSSVAMASVVLLGIGTLISIFSFVQGHLISREQDEELEMQALDQTRGNECARRRGGRPGGLKRISPESPIPRTIGYEPGTNRENRAKLFKILIIFHFYFDIFIDDIKIVPIFKSYIHCVIFASTYNRILIPTILKNFLLS